MASVEDTLKAAKDKLPNVTPTPPDLHAHATMHELKSRLEWGEPALTIFDVRDQVAFTACRIMGAVSLPLAKLQQGEKPSLEAKRDIYVYAETDANAAVAADLMRTSGFSQVAQLTGGLQVWQSIGGTTEGLETEVPTTRADEFNVFSRLKKFSAEKSQEGALKSK